MLQAFILSLTLVSGGSFVKYNAVCYGKQGQSVGTYKCEFGDALEGRDPQSCRGFRVVDVSIPHTSLVQADVSVKCKEYRDYVLLSLNLTADPRAPIRETEAHAPLRQRIVFDEELYTADGEVYSAEEL